MARPFAKQHSSSLAHKIKEEEIITVSAKAKGEQAATWAPKCAQHKQQYPSHTLCCSVSLAIQTPLAVKIEKQENSDISYRESNSRHDSEAAVHYDREPRNW